MRTYNLREVKPLRNLDPQHIDQMVALRGMVIRTSQIIPDLKQAFFRCIVCNASKEVRKPICRTVVNEMRIGSSFFFCVCVCFPATPQSGATIALACVYEKSGGTYSTSCDTVLPLEGV